MDPAHKQVRGEYVLGRIALAKGDLPAAKEHIANYIKLDAAAPDISKIQALLESLGAGAAPTSLPLEHP